MYAPHAMLAKGISRDLCVRQIMVRWCICPNLHAAPDLWHLDSLFDHLTHSIEIHSAEVNCCRAFSKFSILKIAVFKGLGKNKLCPCFSVYSWWFIQVGKHDSKFICIHLVIPIFFRYIFFPSRMDPYFETNFAMTWKIWI